MMKQNRGTAISHLWALHPAFQITPDNTPDLCDAAKSHCRDVSVKVADTPAGAVRGL